MAKKMYNVISIEPKIKENICINEKEGQIKFFKDLKIDSDVTLSNNTDGVYKGTIFEFKLTIPNINRVLFQTIKYLSHMRIKGKSIPKTILLVALNENIAYKFKSKDFLKEIEQIYIGASSQNNKEFYTEIKPEKIDYSNIEGLGKLTKILQDEGYTKIHIDVFNVVAWAKRFYAENIKSNKSKLFDELKNPKHFKELLYPWKGNESDFKYIMDLLNDKMHQKELGAFYTPAPYAKKALELVRQAIKQVPKDHDYIIVDRCAGTGNLEEFLTDKNVSEITIRELGRYVDDEFKKKYLRSKAEVITTFYPDKIFHNITLGELEKHKTTIDIRDYLFDNELSHCIVATYELKEWIVLNERIGDKVNTIIPEKIDISKSLIEEANALEIDIFDAIKPYVENEKCNIIMLENPPYRDSSASNVNNKKNKSNKGVFICEEMKKDLTQKSKSQAIMVRDLSNQFIWSAWKYYLTKENDCYILFSPIKYWKSLGLCNKTFIDGYLFNRKHFHATPSSISCIGWKNINNNSESIKLKAFDIDTKKNIDETDDEILNINKKIIIKKAKTTLISLFDSRKFKTDIKQNIHCDYNGYETNRKAMGRGLYNKNILGYLRTTSYNLNQSSVCLIRCFQYDGHGFPLRSDNYVEKLPLFCAKLYPQKNWYEKDIYFTTADSGDKYTKDKDFLKSCLIYTCLSPRNHCLSFNGSDKRFYKNELCFDEGTLATTELKQYKLDKTEKDLINLFEQILKESKKTKNYNDKYKYGTYQIDKELNTYIKDDKITIYDYPELNTKIIELKNKLAKYYENIIQPKLFEYELLK